MRPHRSTSDDPWQDTRQQAVKAVRANPSPPDHLKDTGSMSEAGEQYRRAQRGGQVPERQGQATSSRGGSIPHGTTGGQWADIPSSRESGIPAGLDAPLLSQGDEPMVAFNLKAGYRLRSPYAATLVQELRAGLARHRQRSGSR